VTGAFQHGRDNARELGRIFDHQHIDTHVAMLAHTTNAPTTMAVALSVESGGDEGQRLDGLGFGGASKLGGNEVLGGGRGGQSGCVPPHQRAAAIQQRVAQDTEVAEAAGDEPVDCPHVEDSAGVVVGGDLVDVDVEGGTVSAQLLKSDRCTARPNGAKNGGKELCMRHNTSIGRF